MTAPPKLQRLGADAAKYLPTLLGLVLLAGAIFVVQREFKHLNLHEVGHALHAMPVRALSLSGCATICAYLILSCYDKLGTIYAGAKVSYVKNLFASFCAYSLAHNLGFAAVSGAAVRYRLYAHWGLSVGEIAKLVAFCSLTFGLGGMTLGGFILFLEPHAVPYLGSVLPLWLLYAIGAALWLVVILYILVSLFFPVLRVRGKSIELPGLKMALVQVALATADVAATASVFYLLLPHGYELSFFHFLAIYLGAYAAGLVANVPGGLGVFDAAILVGLDTYLPAPAVLSALFVYRLYYYIIPLFLSGALFAGNEFVMRGSALQGSAGRLPRWNEPDFAVATVTGMVALSGAALLSLGVLDTHPDYSWLAPHLSVVAANAGQYVTSILGTFLMATAVGLAQRVSLAWWGGIGFLLLGAVICALQGESVFLPLFLVAAAGCLAPFHAAFYRSARVVKQPLHAVNVLPLFALLSSVFWLASFEPKLRSLAQTSWWQVVISQAAPASLRHAVGFATFLAVAGLWGVLRPAQVRSLPWNATSQLRYAAMGGAAPDTADGLVLGEAGQAGMVFCRFGEVLIALGDPVGAHADRISAIWRLRDLAVLERRRMAVYRAGSEFLKIYGGLGLTAMPLGPDGVPLPRDAAGPLPGRLYLCCVAERDVQKLLPILSRRIPQSSGNFSMPA